MLLPIQYTYERSDVNTGMNAGTGCQSFLTHILGAQPHQMKKITNQNLFHALHAGPFSFAECKSREYFLSMVQTLKRAQYSVREPEIVQKNFGNDLADSSNQDFQRIDCRTKTALRESIESKPGPLIAGKVF